MNGYISMGNKPSDTKLKNFPLHDAYKIVAPFADSIDLSIGGSVTYTNFSGFTSIESVLYDGKEFRSQLNDVSEFIRERIAFLSLFFWKRMMVVELSRFSLAPN